jgi:pimeloyl-ACP methyl ester carboxylesterase
MKSLFPLSIQGISIAIALCSFLATSASAQSSSTSTACDKDCQDLVDTGLAFERSSRAHEGVDDFYTIPDEFDPSMEPGTLLRVEEHTDITNYTVPSGLTMSRIMYTSESLNGTVVPVSAFVLWPYTPFEYEHKTGHSDSSCLWSNTSASTKFPLVAWAHGTSGVFPPCAPSNYRSLQYNFMTAYSLALDGFAVIATDYAGLGVTTLPDGAQSHAWLAGPAGANDVAYAIDAVRKAFPANLEADGPFVAMGHSQGGGVAWSFAERQAVHPQEGYRGTISISPATRVIDEIERAMEVLGSAEDPATVPIWAPTALGLQVKVVAAVTAVYPEYNDTGMSDAAYDRWHNVLEPAGGCLVTDTLSFLSVTDQVRANWTADPLVREWQDVASSGRKAFRGPMLVIVGGEDALPVGMLEDDVEVTCAVKGNEGQGLEMAVYGGMQHFPVIQASRGMWMRWVKERVSSSAPAGHHVGGGVCGKKTVVEGFNTEYTSHTIAPNWLVSWASPMEAYKYAL